jgi:hypothetical protein
VTTKSISIKDGNSKSGGCAGKAHELTSGGLLGVRAAGSKETGARTG